MKVSFLYIFLSLHIYLYFFCIFPILEVQSFFLPCTLYLTASILDSSICCTGAIRWLWQTCQGDGSRHAWTCLWQDKDSWRDCPRGQSSLGSLRGLNLLPTSFKSWFLKLTELSYVSLAQINHIIKLWRVNCISWLLFSFF